MRLSANFLLYEQKINEFKRKKSGTIALIKNLALFNFLFPLFSTLTSKLLGSPPDSL